MNHAVMIQKIHTPKKKTIHGVCGYSLDWVTSYGKRIHKTYRGKDCMKKLGEDLKALAMEQINFEEKEMIPLTHHKQAYHEKQKYCHIYRKKFCDECKIYHKVRDHCHYTGKYRGAAHKICNLRYKTQREIPVISHNGSNYYYHFIINELPKHFKGSIDCLGENMEKYTTFELPIKKMKK